MKNHCFSAYWMTIVCGLLLLCMPCIAAAQESNDSAHSLNAENSQTEISEESDSIEVPAIYTAKDNFGGWKFDAEILLGLNWFIDDDNDDGGNDQEFEHDNAENLMINGTLQLQLSYLWGNGVYFGPVLNVITGWPTLFSVDLRLRLLIPLSSKDAVSGSAGWGVSISSLLSGEEYIDVSAQPGYPQTKDYSDIYNMMYFPIEMTYEHVFDNRFVLGASIQFIIAERERSYYTKEASSNRDAHTTVKYLDGNKYSPIINAFTAGIHLGYKF